MTDNSNSCSCAKKTCTHRFTKIYTVEVSKDVTVGQLYRYLSLHKFSEEQQSLLDLSLAMDKRGKSRGIAFIRVPCMLEDHVLAHEGQVFKGKKLRFSEEKRKHASLLKKGRWVRDYKTTTKATVCLNQLPLHRECYQDKAEDVKGFTEPVFDVGARLYHPKFNEDLDTVLAKAHSLGLREINLPCISSDLWDDAIKLVDMYKGKFDIYFSAGVGPWYCKKWGPEAEAKLKTLYKMERCSSAGLIGLDFRADNLKNNSKEVQLEVFEAQVKLACTYGKSMMLVDQKAHMEMVNILERHKNYLPPCAMWGYATDRQSEIKKYVELGCYIVVSDHAYHKYYLNSGVRLAIESEILPVSKILMASNSPGNHPKPVDLIKFALPKKDPVTVELVERHFKLLDLYADWHSNPLCVFILKDLIANALGRPVDNCDDLTRKVYDNTRKFFQLGKYKMDEADAWARMTTFDGFDFIEEILRMVFENPRQYIAIFILTFSVALVMFKLLVLMGVM